jgi:thioredoxin reductase (NADPH)
MFLAERCAKRVHLLVRRTDFGPGMSDYLADRIRRQPNIQIHTGVEVSAVHGNGRIQSADLRHVDGLTSSIDLSAIFVFIGAEPGADWLPNLVARDKLGYLLTGQDALTTGHGRWRIARPRRWKRPYRACLRVVMCGRGAQNAWVLPWVMDRWQ